MKKEFCDGCGTETTDQKETGKFMIKHMPDERPLRSWSLKKYDLCETCAPMVERFVQSLATRMNKNGT